MPLRPIPPSPQSMKAQIQGARDELAKKVQSAEAKRDALKEELIKLRLSSASGYAQTGLSVQKLDELSTQYQAQIEQKDAEYKQRASELRKLEKQAQQFDADLANIDQILDPAD